MLRQGDDRRLLNAKNSLILFLCGRGGPGFVAAKELVQSGAIGEIKAVVYGGITQDQWIWR